MRDDVSGRRDVPGDPLVIAAAALLVVGVPLLTARGSLSEEQLAEIPDARNSVYLSAALSLVFLAGAFFLVALWRDVPPELTGWRVEEPLPAFAWAAATTLAGLAVVWILVRVGARLGLSESGIALALMPRNGREIRGFLLLSGVAAVAEEYLFRGFAQGILGQAFGTPWPAVAVVSVSFGISHGYQRLIGIVRATLLGALLAVPVVRTGSLFPAIVAHFWINAAIGVGGWKVLYPRELLAAHTSETNRTP